MNITPTNFYSYNVSYKKNNSKNFYNTDKKEQNKMTNLAIGLGITGMLIVTAGITSKGSFDKNIIKKGLEFKDNILINKSTGEKFTGKIKTNIGKIGFNRIETRNFQDGIIVEKTYKDLLGNELEGYFYKEGKECLHTHIGYPTFVPWTKAVTAYHRNEAQTKSTHIDMRKFKGSVFDWARKFVKDNGWFSKSK